MTKNSFVAEVTFKLYWKAKKKLCEHNNVILRGERILLSKSLTNINKLLKLYMKCTSELKNSDHY